MNVGHVSQGLLIPKHIQNEMRGCNVRFSEIRGVKASTEKAPFTCGHQLDKNNLALCGYHHSLTADFALSVADEPERNFDELKDYSFNEKDFEGAPSFGERVKNFFSKHPLLTLMAAGTAVITGMALYKATDENSPEIFGMAKRLVNAEAMPEGQSHVVEIRSDAGLAQPKTCAGSALSEDIIITAASCVTHLDNKLHGCKHADGSEATLEDYYGDDDDIDDSSGSGDFEGFRDDDIVCKSSDDFINLPTKNVTVVFGKNEDNYEVDSIITHSEFNATEPNMHRDIALIKLKNKIPNIRTVQLPTEKINKQLRLEIAANGDGARPLHPNNLVLEGWATSNATHLTMGNWQIKQTALDEIEEIEAMKEQNLYKQFDCEKYLCSKSTNGKEQHIHGIDYGAPVIFHGNTTTPYLVGVAAQSSKSHVMKPDPEQPNGNNSDLVPLIFTDTNPATISVNVYNHKEWIEDNLQKLNAGAQGSSADVVLGVAAVVGAGAAMACVAKKALSFRLTEPGYAEMDAISTAGEEAAESLV